MRLKGPCKSFRVLANIKHSNEIYRFVVGDWSHPESEIIQKKLKEIRKKMKNESGINGEQSLFFYVMLMKM